MADPAQHPLAAYASHRGLTRRQTAAVFEIEYGIFRQLVSGHTRASFRRAEAWERASDGGIKAIDVMRWQERKRMAAA